MVGVTHRSRAHSTVTDVEQAWQQWADKHGFTVRRRRNDFSTGLHSSRKTVVVHISAGKWVADCPDCNGGIAAWPLHERGACLDCGTAFHLAYPSREDCLELAELMAARPERARNFFPHKDETIDDARRENAVNRFADERPAGVVPIATLRDTLSPAAYAELEQAGLV
jgi:hypothetical protein